MWQTVAGFTPVLLESPYTDSLVFKTITSTTATTSTYDPSPTTSYNTFKSTYTDTSTVVTTAPSTYLTTALVSTTVTDSSPTQTVYDACKPNNGELSTSISRAGLTSANTVASKIPTGQYINDILNLGAIQLEQHVADATACCALCQKTKGCIGSQYAIETGELGQLCAVMVPNPNNASQTCDPRGMYGEWRGVV